MSEEWLVVTLRSNSSPQVYRFGDRLSAKDWFDSVPVNGSRGKLASAVYLAKVERKKTEGR